MKRIFTSLLCGLMTTAAFAQWSPTSMQGEKIRTASNVKSYYSLDLNAMRSKLANAQETGSNAVPVEIKLPTLNGKIERFAVYSSPVVVKSIADRYQLGSYVGVGIDDPNAIVRFSVAPNDFQSMIVRNGKYEFIEPQNTSKTVYGVHPKTNKTEEDKAFVCSTSEAPLTKAQMDKLYMSGKSFTNNPTDFSKASDKKFRTMRLAMTTNGEYTQYFGGVAGAMTAINATLTRCNGVFEMDFGLRLILQDFPALIYTDPATDPYSTTLSSWNLSAQKAITAVAGEANYDIGHMFGASGGGGNAGCIGCVCISPPLNGSGVPTGNGKGSGITSPADGIPMGDNFDIDYVAHEIGHQLGANHTFSMSLEGTGQNVEPGSGSTVMGYAGITGATDVQPHSDAYFHINSIIQVQNNLVAKTCDIETPVNNNPPVITAMADLTIPKGTAFVLTAQATDPENDPMTYTWEQVDNASSGTTIANLGTLTNGPTFRSWTPTASPTRYFPKLST
ncbi:MAG TPA: propanediol utilization protein, partial [Chryseobacterium sp.]|nr:propanediol utilization protein [Chryseobacterium sp.]